LTKFGVGLLGLQQINLMKFWKALSQ